MFIFKKIIMPYDFPESRSYDSSRSSFEGRKCRCCCRLGIVLLTIEMLFAITSSFILVKEFLMRFNKSRILGKDLVLAYILRDEDINISFIGDTNITIINGTHEEQSQEQEQEQPSGLKLLSSGWIEYGYDFVNTTVRDFVKDIVRDIKESTFTIDNDKAYFVSSMEFTYLTLALEFSASLYILVMFILLGYFCRNYLC